MSPRGRTLATASAVVLLFLLPLLPEVLGSRLLVFRDAALTHWPWRRTAMAALDAGRVPFINGHAAGGQPFLANPNAVLLYPTVLLEKILRPVSAFNLHYLLSTIWAFLGAAILARRLGISRESSLFAGVAFAFSGIMISYGSAFMNSGASASWLPWCAAAALGLLSAETLGEAARAAAATGLAFGLQLLGGEPALCALTGAFVAVLCLIELSRKRRVEWPRGLALLVGGGVAAIAAAAAFAAPLLLPLRAVFPLTYRGQHAYSMRAFGASPFLWPRVLEWLFPRFAGDPSLTGSGANWIVAKGGDLVYIWSVTFGVLAAIVILLAAFRRDFWTPRAIAIGLFASVAWIFSFGFRLPLYALLFRFETLRRLRYPIKFYLLTTICVALLAGLAADSVRSRRPGRREALVLGALLAVFFAGFAVSSSPEIFDRVIAVPFTGVGIAQSALLAPLRASFRSDAIVGGAAVLIVGAMVRFGRRVLPGNALALLATLFALPWALPLFVSGSARETLRPPALAARLQGAGRIFFSPAIDTPDFDALQGGRPGPPRYEKIVRGLIEVLAPSTGESFGIDYVLSHDPDGSYGWYNRIASEAVGTLGPLEKSRLLRAYGARWILSEDTERFPIFDPIVGMLVAGRRLVLHGTPNPVPDVRWIGRDYRRSSLSGAIELVRSERFEPLTDVVLPGSRDRDPPPPAGVPATGAVDLSLLTPDEVAGSVTAPAGGHVVFARTFFPSWRASVDGQPVRPVVANARDVAVPVPAGSHRFEISWDRGPFQRGVLWQGLALLAALAAGLLSRSRIPQSS